MSQTKRELMPEMGNNEPEGDGPPRPGATVTIGADMWVRVILPNRDRRFDDAFEVYLAESLEEAQKIRQLVKRVLGIGMCHGFLSANEAVRDAMVEMTKESETPWWR